MLKSNIKLIPLKEILNEKLHEMYQDIPIAETGSTNKLNGYHIKSFKINVMN